MTDNKSIPDERRDTLQNILTEEEVLKLTGLNKNQLAECRNSRRLPFLKISRNCRLYLESDLVTWFKGSRMILNTGE